MLLLTNLRRHRQHVRQLNRLFCNKEVISVVLALYCTVCILFFYHLHNTGHETISESTASYDKSAVFMDNRYEPLYGRIIQNFIENLDRHWQIEIFTLPHLFLDYRNDPILHPFFTTEGEFANKIVLKDLSAFVTDTYCRKEFKPFRGKCANKIWRDAEFVQRITYEKILVFQSDSVLCSNSKYKVEDFLHYDYVGAPWGNGNIGNGGLSLRSKSKVLQALHEFGPEGFDMAEDVWHGRYIAKLDGSSMPTTEVAQSFSIEHNNGKNVWVGLIPAGCHQCNLFAPHSEYSQCADATLLDLKQ